MKKIEEDIEEGLDREFKSNVGGLYLVDALEQLKAK